MNDNHLVGVFYDMSNDAHHAHPAIGSSGLKLLAQTPLHYWSAYRDNMRAPRVETAAFRIGRLTHSATLEPHKISETMIVMPEGLDRRTKEGKALWEEIVSSGREPVLQSHWDAVCRMAAMVRRHPAVRVLFDQCGAKTEVSIFWVDPATGLNCKIRPDIMVAPCELFPNGLIADLKTTEDASPEAFGKSVWNFDMHLQAAMYPEGFMAAFGTAQPPDFLWIAQEKSAPYANKIYSCSEALSRYGRREVNRLRSLLAVCLERDEWPGYDLRVSELLVPGWAQKIIDEAAAA